MFLAVSWRERLHGWLISGSLLTAACSPVRYRWDFLRRKFSIAGKWWALVLRGGDRSRSLGNPCTLGTGMGGWALP